MYPKKLEMHYHHAKIIVPPLIAHILSLNPRLIAPAVEAFYTRDPVSMRACYKMNTFAPENTVETVIPFTRTLYAQLVSQNFYPPKSFKPPPMTSPNYKAFDLGMKLVRILYMIYLLSLIFCKTCGFEILYNDKHLRQTSRMNSKTDFEVF